MTHLRTSVRVGAIAIMAATFGVAAGCDTSGKGTTTTTPGNPLVFSARDGNMDCIYTYSPGGSPSDPDFTLDYGSGAGSISVSASYSVNYEGPPNSMQITYGDPAAPDFDSGLISLFAGDPAVTVTEHSPTDWSMEWVGAAGAQATLPWGSDWTITFSCGSIPSCCADTTSVDVSADGVF